MENDRKPGGLEKFQVTDREECGVIVQRKEPGDPMMTYVLRIPNRSSSPDDYEIHKSDVDKIEAVLSDEETIIGYMHTHLPHHSASPSDRDFDGAALSPDKENLVYQPSTKMWTWYGSEVKD